MAVEKFQKLGLFFGVERPDEPGRMARSLLRSAVNFHQLGLGLNAAAIEERQSAAQTVATSGFTTRIAANPDNVDVSREAAACERM